MKTLSNIIPNPLNVNKILNSNYSTSRFATSDYNGKENTKAMQNHSGNIAVNRVSESGEDFYIGGIGEIGLVMQNVDLINNKIKEYKGTEIPLDGKYVSSTLYNKQDQTNEEYTSGNANNIWYYDVSYGMINHGQFTSAYRKLPLYKYDIKDFDGNKDEFDEYDNNDLYLDITYANSFNIFNYFYYCQDDTLDNLTNSVTYHFFGNTNNLPNNQNIVQYPIYQKNGIYSMPLLPSYKFDNHYDCEFFVFLPYFVRKKKQIYNIDLIYKKIKLVIKLGNGDIKEVLDPFIRLEDCVIYKFHKQWLYDYMFINNQEIIISLVDYGADQEKDKVLVSKKIFFNLFKIMFYQGKYSNYNFRFKYSNYYPLKYPLSTNKKKFLELNYVPYENIENFDEQSLVNVGLDATKISEKDPYINLSDISNNYAYLNSYIYHNLSEGNNIVEWFIRENGNGLIQNKILEFFIENPDKKTLDCFSKTFVNYDADGILESNINITKINSEDITHTNPNLVKYNNFNVNGLKQIIYLPYDFNIPNIYGFNSASLIMYTNTNTLSIFEDYLYIYNSTSNAIKLYFTDESLTLCENTRIINIPSHICKIYRPSKHDDYNIIVKNCLLNTYKLSFFQIYKPFINNSNKIVPITTIINSLNTYIQANNGTSLNITSRLQGMSNQMLVNSENNEIVKVPIYDYSIPLLGNIIIITK